MDPVSLFVGIIIGAVAASLGHRHGIKKARQERDELMLATAETVLGIDPDTGERIPPQK